MTADRVFRRWGLHIDPLCGRGVLAGLDLVATTEKGSVPSCSGPNLRGWASVIIQDRFRKPA